MRILFIGDVFGRSGRDALEKHLPTLKAALSPDAIIINGDNAAHGRGITPSICAELFDMGAACITSGDHVWDQREIIPHIDSEKRLIRPLNYAAKTPGMGTWSGMMPGGQKLIVVHLQGQVFMKETDSPFVAMDRFLEQERLGRNVSIFVDIHAEATSEKMAMGHYLDGRVSAVVGTHTHIPTADAQIFPAGTAYQTDAGMTGDFNSVIGARVDDSLFRFTTRMPRPLVPADGEATLCGVFVETDDSTGLARSISPVRVGGRLSEALPTV
jgi:metallophosphoesterase (TIGR00282 family)